MSDLRSRVIRLAHANPALRPHLLPLLKRAASKEIVDPQTGKTYAELKAEYKETLDRMYDAPSSPSQDKKIKQYEKDMGARLDRLRQREEKAKRGLRISSRPNDLSGFPSKGDWGILGSNVAPSAILQGSEVVGWMIQKTTDTTVRGTTPIALGRKTSVTYTPYQLDGKKIPGVVSLNRPNDALDFFHRWLTERENAPK